MTITGQSEPNALDIYLDVSDSVMEEGDTISAFTMTGGEQGDMVTPIDGIITLQCEGNTPDEISVVIANLTEEVVHLKNDYDSTGFVFNME